jgi:hypothetical protein
MSATLGIAAMVSPPFCFLVGALTTIGCAAFVRTKKAIILSPYGSNWYNECMRVLSKIPTRQELLPVFSLILFIVYSWTIYRMLFQIPSWLYSHSKTGIFFLVAYVFAVALIESLFLFGFILLVNLILPRRLFRDQFIAQGSLMVIACTIWALILKFQNASSGLRNLLEVSAWILVFILSLLIIAVVSSFLMQRYQRGKSVLESIADRMIIFAWIYVPVGLVSLAIVLVRNLI